MKKIYFFLFLISLALITVSVLGIYKQKQILSEKPSDLVVANITSTTAEIYWKGESEDIPALFYKESSSDSYTKATELNIYNDNLSDLYIYEMHVNGLDPDTEYVFEIQTKHFTWGTDDSQYIFSTKPLKEEPTMLNAVTGTSIPENLVLLETENDKYILDTQYHGTWAVDTEEEYATSPYGNYMPSSQFTEYSLSLFGISPVYALSGANCKTGSNANYSTASKSNIVSLATRWTTSCSKGHYASECYSDVICRASSSGIDPAFALTIWLNESDASNYAYNSNVQDFGINGGGVSNADFSAQLNRFLSLVSKGTSYLKSYTTSCGYDTAISQAKSASSAYDPELIVWGAIYLTGNGCNTSKGLTYISGIAKVYNWVTNGTLKWPLTKTTNISGCTFTSTNSGYNTCSTTGTSNTSSGSTSNGSNSNSSSGSISCGSYGCSQDSDCEGWDNGKGNYECNERSDGNTSKQRCVRYKCPSDYEVGSDKCSCVPIEEKEVCCLTSDGDLEMVSESKCDGSIQENLDKTSCSISKQILKLSTGVNFVSFTATPYISGEKVTSYSLIDKYPENILVIGEYLGDTWINLVINENGSVSGKEFQILGGRSYLIITTKDFSIDFTEYGTSPIDISSYKGWTLVPKELIGESSAEGIITNYEKADINQVAVWNYSSSRFEDLVQDDEGFFYGIDIYLTDIDSVFVKIE